MIVMKFGGSSVADRARLEHVASLVAAHPGPCAVVVSAMGKTTDRLLRAAALAEAGDGPGLRTALYELERTHRDAIDEPAALEGVDLLLSELRSVLEGIRLLREQTPRSRALCASIGERLSAPLLAAHLRRAGRPAEAVDARRFVVTPVEDGRYEGATVDLEATAAAARGLFPELLERGVVPVVTGFLGATPEGTTTTLGRGGSDYSAALLGALLEAREIWIWTDVTGILTADPRHVREARTLERVSYREAAEMSYFGAKVLHPKTIGPAVAARIPIRIKNTFEPEHPGTLVSEEAPALPQGVKTVSSIHGLALCTLEGRGMAGIPGVARRVFEASEAARVNVMMISQASSEQTISLVVPGEGAGPLTAALRERFALELARGALDGIAVVPEIAIATIVGQGMAGTPGISGKLFGALGAVKVNVLAIAQGASELSISLAVREAEARRAVRAIHSAFGLTRTVNLCLLGAGKVARAFLRQLEETHAGMERELGLELRLVGLATSSRCLCDLEGSGLPLAQLDALLASAEPRPSDEELLARLESGRFTDLVLVDCTAAETTPLLERALAAGIGVVTANKRPLSGPLADWDRLAAAARATGARLAYETTFGAGLPVLHTLQELVHTGDRLREISGCFSGTLGQLCTRLEEGVPLAAALREAEADGLTEPDPREDLSGRDVLRKALIIARTVGLRLEPEAVRLEPFLPELEAGLAPALAKHGPALEARAAEARARGETLRYLATITPERVEVGLRALPLADPLGALRGRDNMLVYRTLRYSELPLVIRGPGAGAEVTAAGVLGDVLKLARH
jgi:aspartokinase/homoserine dehydrogenase 1